LWVMRYGSAGNKKGSRIRGRSTIISSIFIQR
jgi:hypothetical protein